MRIGVFAISVAALLMLCACPNFFTSGDSISTLSVSPGSYFSATGETVNFTATGTTVNGDTKDVTSSAKWTSSNPSVATVSAGVATAVATGTATITAKQDNGSATASMVVTAKPLQSISVTPSSPTVLQTQGTQQFQATGTFTDGSTQDLTKLVKWTSGTTSVATINSGGLASLISAGNSTITATVTTSSGAVTGTTTLTVQ